MLLPNHKTRIVATIGPASESPHIMEQMLRAGMDVARLNFSHGDFDYHARLIMHLRAAARAVDRRLAILADLPGPKMRIGELATEPLELKTGDLFTLTTKEVMGDSRRASVTFTPLPQVVKTKDTLFLNDGLIELEVAEISADAVVCRVVVGASCAPGRASTSPASPWG